MWGGSGRQNLLVSTELELGKEGVNLSERDAEERDSG